MMYLYCIIEEIILANKPIIFYFAFAFILVLLICLTRINLDIDKIK